jgi:hypothetical protein
MGTSVIEGMTVSLGQIWWQRLAMYFAGGMALFQSVSAFEPERERECPLRN